MPAGNLTEVVDVGSHPPAVGQLLQVVGRLVVPADEHREDRCLLLAGVVPAGTRLLLERAGARRDTAAAGAGQAGAGGAHR